MQAVSSPELVDLLIEGARYGDAEDVKLALDQGASADCRDEQGRTGTCWQAYEGRLLLPSFTLPSVRLCLGAGLHMASANGSTEVVHLLLHSGAVRL